MLAPDCPLMFTPMIVARQHGDAIIAEIHTPTSVRVLRFNALTGFWEEFGRVVPNLPQAVITFLQSAAPWTIARYVAPLARDGNAPAAAAD